MGPTLPPIDRYAHRRESQRNATEMFREFGHKLQAKHEKEEENAHFRERGVELKGLGPEARSYAMQTYYKKEEKRARNEGMRDRNYPGNEKHSSESWFGAQQTKKKEPLPGFMGREEIEPKKGLYSQKTTQGELVPIRSAQQVEQDGIARARQTSEDPNGFSMSDQEGIDYETEKNNRAIQSNQIIQGEQQALQGEKSGFNQKGRAEAINTIGPENLNPGVAAFFGQKAEQLAGEVNTESELDKKLAKEIENYKNTVAIVENSVHELPVNKMGDDSLGEKVISDYRNKIKPILDMGLFDMARNLLAGKGLGPEQRETVISNLSESTNKILSEIPTLRTHQKLAHPRAGPAAAVVRDYSPDQKEVINNTMQKIFKKDPSTNMTLLRRQMRDEKNIDWRAFKEGLDYAIYTGALTLNAENRNEYARMSEPEESGLQQLLRLFGVGGR